MKPTAEGNFQKTPLANVLLYSRERRMTGSLAITIKPDSPDQVATLDVAGLSTLVLENGSIVAVQTPSQSETLSGTLHATGALSEETLAKVREALTKPGGTDEVSTLLRLRAADMTTIEHGLRELARRKVLSLFGYPRGAYAYYAGVDLLGGSDRLRAPEDVLPVVWRSFITHPPDEAAVTAIVEKLGARALRLRDGSEFDRFEFGEELGLAPAQLRTAPSGLDQLMGLAPDPVLVRRMVYLLALTRQVEVAPAAASMPSAVATAPGVGATPPRPPPIPQAAVRSSLAPESAKPPPFASAPPSQPELTPLSVPPPTASTAPLLVPSGAPPMATPSAPPEKPDITNHPKWKEARAHLTKLEHKNYFEMFDLAENATLDEIKQAFPKAAAAWHPDRSPLPELHSLYEEIFALYNTAYATLTSKDARAQYEESLHGGGGTPAAQRKVAAVLDTVQDVHRAEVALRRRDFPEAERLLRHVLEASDDDVSAMLLLAQCLLETDPARHAEEAINLMAKVMQSTEGNDRARLYLGLALKARNDLGRARACFKQALEMNPNNIEASRELRLIEMRIQQRRDEKAAQGSIGGLFNKFLKK